jgi:MYXO-CTERM domain-containing protein
MARTVQNMVANMTMLRRFLCPSFALAFGALLLGMPSVALAQVAPSVKITQSTIKRINADGTDAPSRNGIQLNTISREDCDLDRAYSFPIALANIPTNESVAVQVWAGATDCTSLGNRTPLSTQQCWRVNDKAVARTLTPGNIVLRVRDLLSNDKTRGTDYVGPVGAAICANNTLSTVSVYMFWTDGGNNLQGEAANYALSVSTLGPSAPSGVSVSGGDGLVTVKWTPATGVSAVQGYDVYCELASNPVTTASRGLNTLAIDGGLVEMDGAADDATTDALTVSEAGMDATARADASAADASVGPNACGSTTLVEGASPGAGLFKCATVTGAQVGTAVLTDVGGKPIKNGDVVTVAVASRDRFGTTGKLSNVACQSALSVDDFYETYRAATGNDSAANCSVSGGGASGAAALGLVMAGLAASRRRQPKQGGQ